MRLICGIDEAGRGALFGPVVVAACVFKESTSVQGLKDSKALSPYQRITLFHRIILVAEDYYWITVGPKRIDEYNILKACLFGFKKCIERVKADIYIIDGPHSCEPKRSNVVAVPKADSIHEPVMAASVLAKVIRDTLISQMSEKYAVYGLSQNKGYGTVAHRESIQEFGLSRMHRTSFCKGWTQTPAGARNNKGSAQHEVLEKSILL